MRRPRADREEKRVTRGKDTTARRREEQLDPDNPNQRGLSSHSNRGIRKGVGHHPAPQPRAGTATPSQIGGAAFEGSPCCKVFRRFQLLRRVRPSPRTASPAPSRDKLTGSDTFTVGGLLPGISPTTRELLPV